MSQQISDRRRKICLVNMRQIRQRNIVFWQIVFWSAVHRFLTLRHFQILNMWQKQPDISKKNARKRLLWFLLQQIVTVILRRESASADCLPRRRRHRKSTATDATVCWGQPTCTSLSKHRTLPGTSLSRYYQTADISRLSVDRQAMQMVYTILLIKWNRWQNWV